MGNLKDILEAILFVVGRSVSINEFKETLGVNAVDVENALKELETKYENNSGLSLVKVKDEYQLVSNKAYFEYIAKFAYNPKITKSEIESIRGVNSDSQVSKLLEYGLVEEVGRMNAPGRPAMFSVTNEFLRCMGINKVEDLPDYNTIKTEDDELTLFKNIETEEEKKITEQAEQKEKALV